MPKLQRQRQSREASVTQQRAHPAAAVPARSAAILRHAPGTVVQWAMAAPHSLQPSEFLVMQRTLGNNATGAMLGRGPVQAKLTINAPGDRWEREADRIADAVMRGHDETAGPQLSPSVMLEPNTSQASEDGIAAAGDFAHHLQASRGRPLPPALRDTFEGKLGADFGGVRVHTDAAAGRLSRAIQAQAFTRGPEIFVGPGHYAPGTAAGQRLLAHELTHVLQQGAAPLKTPTAPLQEIPQSGMAAPTNGLFAADHVSTGAPAEAGVKAPELPQIAQPCMVQRRIEKGKLNLVGEEHNESGGRRDSEKAMIKEKYNFLENQYWKENEFYSEDQKKYGDAPDYLIFQSAAILLDRIEDFKWLVDSDISMISHDKFNDVVEHFKTKPISDIGKEVDQFVIATDFCDDQGDEADDTLIDDANGIIKMLHKNLTDFKSIEEGVAAGDYDRQNLPEAQRNKLAAALEELSVRVTSWQMYIRQFLNEHAFKSTSTPEELIKSVATLRSLHMLMAAEASKKTGVWKVGDAHILEDMLGLDTDKVTITSQAEFNKEYHKWRRSALEKRRQALRRRKVNNVPPMAAEYQ